MNRDRALVSLSRDHHQTLRVAQVLRRATSSNADAARAAFLTHWDSSGRRHFRQEEDILLPAYAAHGDPFHPLVARTLCEHVDIRHRADALALAERPSLATLHELGTTLAAHVRGEERELFVLIERALPAEELAALAAALAHGEGDTSKACVAVDEYVAPRTGRAGGQTGGPRDAKGSWTFV